MAVVFCCHSFAELSAAELSAFGMRMEHAIKRWITTSKDRVEPKSEFTGAFMFKLEVDWPSGVLGVFPGEPLCNWVDTTKYQNTENQAV